MTNSVGSLDNETAKHDNRDCALGILFVHGIGAQRRGETLAAFGGPVCEWLTIRFDGLDRQWRAALTKYPALLQWHLETEDWATDGFRGAPCPPPNDDTQQHDSPALIAEVGSKLNTQAVVARARLLDTRVTDPDDPSAPAQSILQITRLNLTGDVETERWCLAESWWAETFGVPGFGNLMRWGLRTIPWTIGSHFGSQLRRALARRVTASAASAIEPGWRRVARQLAWAGSVSAALLSLVGGVLLSPLLLAAFGLLLLLALLPIPQLREALLKIQLSIASTLGDSYVLLSRPVESAAIVGQVHRDLNWLGRHCRGVAIVAHSQGGAVAHQALRRKIPAKLRLLFTFGSGLKKLEQLRYLMSSGHSFRNSAVISIIALPIFAVTLLWFASLPFMTRSIIGNPELLKQLPIMLGWAVVTGLFAFAGLRDYTHGLEPPELTRWLKRLNQENFKWIDSYATADPVSNGLLLDDESMQQRSVEVCNYSSVLRDHTAYWQNRDHFSSLLMTQLASPTLRSTLGLSPSPELVSDTEMLNWLAARRRWRVGMLTGIHWLAGIAVAIAAYQYWPAWQRFLGYWSESVFSWSGRYIGTQTEPAEGLVVSWPAIGYLALAVVPFLIARGIWRSWNNAEMHQLIARQHFTTERNVMVAVFFQAIITLGLLYNGVPGYLMSMALLLTFAFTVVKLEPRQLESVSGTPQSGLPEEQSLASRLGTVLLTIVYLIAAPFIAGYVIWEALIWLVTQVAGGSILGFHPSSVPAAVVGAICTVLFLLIGVYRSTRQQASGDEPADYRRSEKNDAGTRATRQ